MKTIGINGSFIRKPASGMGQVSWHFIRELLKKDFGSDFPDTNFIIYLEEEMPTELKEQKLPDNITIKVVSNWYKRDDLIKKVIWEKYLLPRQVKRDRCNVLISLYQSATILGSITEHHILVHDLVPEIFPEYLNNNRKKIYYKLVGDAIKKADKISTVSKHSREDIVSKYGIKADTITVANISCDPIFSRNLTNKERVDSLRRYGIKKDEKFVLFEGGLDVRKNVSRVIEAYGLLAQTTENVPRLVIAGRFHKHLVPLVTDIDKKVKEVVETYGVNKKIFKAIGFVEQEDLPALFQSAEVFVYPSLYEGFGMPVLEAMTSGCPVVTSNTTSIPEVISQEAGYLVNDPESVEEIKEQLKKALADTAVNRNRKTALAIKESKQFSWKRFVDKMLE